VKAMIRTVEHYDVTIKFMKRTNRMLNRHRDELIIDKTAFHIGIQYKLTIRCS